MSHSSIKIGRVTIEAEIKDKAKSKKYFDLFSRLFKTTLEKVIHEAVRKYDDPDKKVTIKKIELDLGEVQIRNLSFKLSRLLDRELKKWLSKNYEIAQKMTGRPVESRFDSTGKSFKKSSQKGKAASRLDGPLVNISSKRLAEKELIKQILKLGFNSDQLDLIPFEVSEKLEVILQSSNESNFLELFDKQITASSVARIRAIVGEHKFVSWVGQLTASLSKEDIRRIYLTEEKMRYFRQKSAALDKVARLPDVFYRIGKQISESTKKLHAGLPSRTFIQDKDGLTQMVDGSLYFRKNFYDKVVDDINLLKEWGFSDWLHLDDLPRDRDRPWDFKRLSKYFDTIAKMPDIRNTMIALSKRAQGDLKKIIPNLDSLQAEIIDGVSKKSWNTIRKYFPKTSHTLLKVEDLTSFEEYFFSSMKQKVQENKSLAEEEKRKPHKHKQEDLDPNKIKAKSQIQSGNLLPSAPIGQELFHLVQIIFNMLERDGLLQTSILKDHRLTQQMSEMLKLLEIKAPSKFKSQKELDLIFYYLKSQQVPSWYDSLENVFPFPSVNKGGKLNINRVFEYQILFIPAFIKAFISKLRSYDLPERRRYLKGLVKYVKNDILFDILQPYLLGSRYSLQASRQALNKLNESTEEVLIHFFEKIIETERVYSIHEFMKTYLEKICMDSSVEMTHLVQKLDVPNSWKETLLAKDIAKIRIDISTFRGFIEKFKLPEILAKELDDISAVIEAISKSKVALHQINNSLTRLAILESLDVWEQSKMQFEDPEILLSLSELRSKIDFLVKAVGQKLEELELERELIAQVEQILRSLAHSDQKATLIRQLEVLVIPLGLDFFPEDLHSNIVKVLPIAESTRRQISELDVDKGESDMLEEEEISRSSIVDDDIDSFSAENEPLASVDSGDELEEIHNIESSEQVSEVSSGSSKIEELRGESYSPPIGEESTDEDQDHDSRDLKEGAIEQVIDAGNFESEQISTEKERGEGEFPEEYKTNELTETVVDLIQRGHLSPEEHIQIEDTISEGFVEQMAEIRQVLSRMRVSEMLQQNWSWVNLALLRTWEEESKLTDLQTFQSDISEFQAALSKTYSNFVKKVRIYMVVNFEKGKYEKKELIQELLKFIAASKSNSEIIQDVMDMEAAAGSFMHGLKTEMERINMKERIEEYFETDEKRSKNYRLLWDKYGGLQDIPIRNAGLVIVWPFISTMFKQLKYFNEKGLWLDKNTQKKAVVLLNYLCSGKEEYEEHFLVFNKVLCGLPVDEPIEAGHVITQSEKRWVKKLLQNTIRQWPALKKTSIESLRGSFLMRNGVLYNKDPNAWLIKVDRKPFDILLTKLPWSFKMIRLRWTIYTITVDWDYQIT